MEILWIIILLGYAVCVAQSIFALTTKRPVMRRTALAALALALGAHTAWLLLRGIRTGRFPLVGTQEMAAFLSWGLVLSTLIAYRWYHANALKAFIFPIVLVLAAIAAISPDPAGQTREFSNTLQSILLPAHVGLLLLAYSSFFVAFGAGVMYIIQERELKNKRFGTIFYKLPSLDTCDAISSRSMAIGFVLMTLGIVGGLWYSYSRYHVYWQAGPLEIFSVVTWLLYLVIIQSRINAGWGGRAAARASILSFIIVICSLVGVRYLGHAF
ncbi:MAG TPA: cytochrome c biogenesis protein CcsA [Blastocatellia bacterium]|nr:cytochrome c biogenesis protein CcsA [Blastocatellia bacterium]